VPEDLKERWQLILGSSREKLPLLLDTLNKIDIFYHDSDHSYENMSFEFNTVFPFMPENGIIVSDDITDNDAFSDFCLEKKCHYLKLFKFGLLKK